MTTRDSGQGLKRRLEGPLRPGGFGRIPIANVSPVVESGAYPAKAVEGEWVPITANVFREGHDAVCATAVLVSPGGERQSVEMVQQEPLGLDVWSARVRPDAPGDWRFRVEGWSDPWRTLRSTARAKLAAEVDVELVCAEARLLLARADRLAAKAKDSLARETLSEASARLKPEAGASRLFDVISDPELDEAMSRHNPRELVTKTRFFPLRVDRRRALFSAWYEFFPRSQGARFDEATKTWISGGFDSSHERLVAAARMGFDIVYLPPIHPIGVSYRKGRNNTLTPGPQDPGSPWAIGSSEGGHDAIHPELGDFEAFARFVAKARSLGLEVALDFALQASPDHPWVKAHPEWFSKRADGTIAYAENPPKKYQDIYPLNFDNDRPGLYAECERVLRSWIDAGVTVFRVDNPHTKPIPFWEWLLDRIHKTNPEVIFLAEAFTKPQMMRTLGKIGFQQSYTYFTWRNRKWELEEYLRELAGVTADYYRPNFFVNTPDINPHFLQSGNPAAFAIRAILASTMSPSWGVYSGFELFEHLPLREGGEEYLFSEKYEFRPRDFDAEPNLNILLGRLNEIRRAHPALQQLRDVWFHHAPHDSVIVFSKRHDDDLVVVVCSLDPDNTVESDVYLDYEGLGRRVGDVLTMTDELGGSTHTWSSRNWVRLHPANPAHIFKVAP